MPTRRLSDALFFQVFDAKPGKFEERRLKIVEATLACIAKKGFDQTTFDAIGKRLKMKRTHIGYYFKNREELALTAVRYAVALGQQITISHVEKARDWRERLQAVVEGPFEWLTVYPKHAPVLSMFYHLCCVDPKHHALQSLIRKGGEARLRACFDELVEDKQMTEERALELARAIQALMTGNIIYSFTSDIPLTLAQLKEWTVSVAMQMVDAPNRR